MKGRIHMHAVVDTGERTVCRQASKTTAAFYIVYTIFMIVLLFSKQELYVDDVYAYTLSNNTDGITISPEDGYTYFPAEDAYLESMTVKVGRQFDYANVWQQQANDVHPPLHYAILHTICSFFPGKYSIWFAGSINIVFALLTLWIARKIVRMLTGDEVIVTIISIFLMASAAILSIIALLRMYTMAMFFTILLSYLFLRGIRTEKRAWRFYLALCLFSVASVLTHYYLIIYVVAACCLFGVYLLYSKKYKETLFFCGTMLLAAGIAILIFPTMIYHIFSGYQGAGVMNTIKNGSGAFKSNFKEYYSFINGWAFGGCLPYLLAAMLLISVGGLLVSRKRGGGLFPSGVRPAQTEDAPSTDR